MLIVFRDRTNGTDCAKALQLFALAATLSTWPGLGHASASASDLARLPRNQTHRQHAQRFVEQRIEHYLPRALELGLRAGPEIEFIGGQPLAILMALHAVLGGEPRVRVRWGSRAGQFQEVSIDPARPALDLPAGASVSMVALERSAAKRVEVSLAGIEAHSELRAPQPLTHAQASALARVMPALANAGAAGTNQSHTVSTQWSIDILWAAAVPKLLDDFRRHRDAIYAHFHPSPTRIGNLKPWRNDLVDHLLTLPPTCQPEDLWLAIKRKFHEVYATLVWRGKGWHQEINLLDYLLGKPRQAAEFRFLDTRLDPAYTQQGLDFLLATMAKAHNESAR